MKNKVVFYQIIQVKLSESSNQISSRQWIGDIACPLTKCEDGLQITPRRGGQSTRLSEDYKTTQALTKW